MHKTLILAAESMHVDQDAVKCAKDAEVALMAQLRSTAENIDKLESELVVLKGSDVFAPTSMQLGTAHQEVAYLKAKFSATQAMLEAAEKEVSHVAPVVKNLERVNSELRSAIFAKDEELVFMYVEVSHLKDVSSKLESKEVDLQGVMSASESLQSAHTRLVEENVQLKNKKVGHEVVLASYQTNFYKLGYVNHLQGRPSDYEFFEKDFETFSISPVDLLDFSFEAAFSGATEGQAIEAVVAEDELMEALAAKTDAVVEGMVVEKRVAVQAADK
ncbi:hypothetical protein FF1_000473 [Malus domestica]